MKRYKIYTKYLICFILFALSFTIQGCKKLVEVDGPTTSVNSEDIYKNDQTATAVLTGIYIDMSTSNLQYANLPGISYLSGLSSDELSLYERATDVVLNGYFQNKLDQQFIGNGFWGSIYSSLYTVNSALDGVSNAQNLTPKVKQQLIGEAKFMRALCFFYLVNLYGDVPLVLGTDYKVNASMPRTFKGEVWKQVISDLTDAQNLLSDNYLDATLLNTTEERVRPTKYAATALLSRAYLYQGEWEKAEAQATSLLENPSFELVKLEEVFLKNNKEAIWQLQGVTKGFNTKEAYAFIISPELGFFNFNPAYLNPSLLESFEPGDLRKSVWTNSIVVEGMRYYFAYKYKIGQSSDVNAPINEYSTVLRLAEQYLIRAEARIQQNKVSEGIADLNALRDRARDKEADPNLQLKLLPADLSRADALMAVEKERRIELFTEWGHRWLDLKRTGRVDAVMTEELPKKLSAGVWNTNQQFYPIDILQLQRNPNLVQNKGY